MSDDWKKRHALHLAAQLPDGYADALDVLRYTRQIVETFMAPVDTPADKPSAVHQLRAVRNDEGQR